MRADGTDQTRRTNDAASDINPTSSPDGKWIAFVGGRTQNKRSTMAANGGNQTRRTTSDGFDTDPNSSPDGKQVPLPAPERQLELHDQGKQRQSGQPHERRGAVSIPPGHRTANRSRSGATGTAGTTRSTRWLPMAAARRGARLTRRPTQSLTGSPNGSRGEPRASPPALAAPDGGNPVGNPCTSERAPFVSRCPSGRPGTTIRRLRS